ncbi:MAG: DUF4149 domain-containing protein [Verrucomicrobiae bacterium]|nr:DUF4149 domain-containing protein [Verrucomicrobiae bacterium]MCP5521230.1 DUF4149 domain-containing protein [Verrucomicrobiales bacterium]
MQTAIRFIGVVNAAIWLGSAVGFTVVVGPAFFSSEMLGIFPRPYAARAVEVVIGRLYSFQMLCAFVALLHLAFEYFQQPRPPSRFHVGLLTVLLGLNLAGTFWLLPTMHQLEAVRYSDATTVEQKTLAKQRFGFWHGSSQVVNLGVMLALGYHLWRLTRPADKPRFSSFSKFRG